MSKRARYSKTARSGVNAVERIVIEELDWIFREQPIEDMGIDAHIERVDDGLPTGKLIGLQIKTGASHFYETNDAYVYYGSDTHIDYWVNHALPVLLIAHLPKLHRTLWVQISGEAISQTSRGWKVEIPKANIFGNEMQSMLAEIFEGAPAQQRLRKLVLDKPLMRHIESGCKVSVDVDDWINKTFGRTPVKVFIYDEDGEETLSKEWFQLYSGYQVKELVEVLFPWASASVDQEFYDQEADDSAGLEDRAVWQDGVYPYAESTGEIESYRIELSLNELGRSFLVITDFMYGDGK